MIVRVLMTELLKIRKKLIWFLIVLGPLGVVGLQGLNYALRYDYLMKRYASDPWSSLLGNVSMLTVPTLFIGLTLIASLTAGIEHQMNAWKQTLALPVTKTQVYMGKFLLTLLLLGCSATLLAIGTIGLGAGLGFGIGLIPYRSLLMMAYYPYLAIVPFIALQVWLSVTMHNQAVPLMIGIAGTVFSLFSVRFGDWMPYKWPYLQNAAGNPLDSVTWGLLGGIVVLGAGLLEFIRKDVK
ncbi:ABC transporter permease [Paenibacillus puerhi]|uniref:ABC transporter permease n=1 Tax=Paenibacillus puerhi TaxID=2692622 RepID=UPI00135C7BB1|nr:ABC transporter permease [Paenibacillus puerhi]